MINEFDDRIESRAQREGGDSGEGGGGGWERDETRGDAERARGREARRTTTAKKWGGVGRERSQHIRAGLRKGGRDQRAGEWQGMFRRAWVRPWSAPRSLDKHP